MGKYRPDKAACETARRRLLETIAREKAERRVIWKPGKITRIRRIIARRRVVIELAAASIVILSGIIVLMLTGRASAFEKLQEVAATNSQYEGGCTCGRKKCRNWRTYTAKG